MIQPVLVSSARGDEDLAQLAAPLDLDGLVEGSGAWEVEIGFGKGRYLLRRAMECPGRRFVGIELVSEYQQILVSRARRRGLRNWMAVRGEALYLLSAVLPAGFASVVHVYFPDPWPKSRHHKRRLFDPESVDLVLGLLAVGGKICFATDFLDYGENVAAILADIPELELTRRPEVWEDGARTNYEDKYIREGRPILRLEGRLHSPLLPPRTLLEVAGGLEDVADPMPMS